MGCLWGELSRQLFSILGAAFFSDNKSRQSGGREDVDGAIYSKSSKTPRVFIETVNCECVLERRLQLLEAYLVLLSRTTSRDLMAYERVPQTW